MRVKLDKTEIHSLNFSPRERAFIGARDEANREMQARIYSAFAIPEDVLYGETESVFVRENKFLRECLARRSIYMRLQKALSRLGRKS